VVRDVLGLAHSYREARTTITEGRIAVDGVVRRDPHFPVGVMDVLEIAGTGKVYRFLPREGTLLVPVAIPETEKSVKLCQIRSKTTVRGGRLQYGLHDGRTILPAGEMEFNVGDSCILDVPSQRVQRALKLEKNAQVMVVRGQNAGTVGQVDQLLGGSFTRPGMARLKVRGRAIEVPTRLLLVVGKDRPAITLGQE
jgi:small subunit ribosomal protein S4e